MEGLWCIKPPIPPLCRIIIFFWLSLAANNRPLPPHPLASLARRLRHQCSFGYDPPLLLSLPYGCHFWSVCIYIFIFFIFFPQKRSSSLDKQFGLGIDSYAKMTPYVHIKRRSFAKRSFSWGGRKLQPLPLALFVNSCPQIKFRKSNQILFPLTLLQRCLIQAAV